MIDWCCFFYFIRNSLVALLEALCAQKDIKKCLGMYVGTVLCRIPSNHYSSAPQFCRGILISSFMITTSLCLLVVCSQYVVFCWQDHDHALLRNAWLFNSSAWYIRFRLSSNTALSSTSPSLWACPGLITPPHALLRRSRQRTRACRHMAAACARFIFGCVRCKWICVS